MAELRLVHFTDPKGFLEAVKTSDHSFFNFTLGQVLDSLDEEQIKVRKLTEASTTLLGVYEADVLMYVAFAPSCG